MIKGILSVLAGALIAAFAAYSAYGWKLILAMVLA
jgi:hypothetical protein